MFVGEISILLQFQAFWTQYLISKLYDDKLRELPGDRTKSELL
jgi:hypothetical protein